MTRVLLTGSHGFVGSAFREWFAANWPSAQIDCVDIRHPTEPRDIRQWVKDHPHEQYDLVVHLAAIVGGRATIDGEPMAVAVDLAIDADLLQWVLRAKPRQVAYFSSSAAYPVSLQTGQPGKYHSGKTPLDEDDIDLDHIDHPDAIYGLVKLVGEQQARHVAAALPDTEILVLRPFSGYGIGQSDDYPVPSIIKRVDIMHSPLPVWSDATRDFVWIDDVVKITMQALAQHVTGPLNICSGIPTSFVRVAEIAAQANGYSPRIEVMQGMPTGVPFRLGDPTRMRQVYGGPLVSLDEGIARMLAHRQGRAHG